jgi:hypothetical protein
MDEISISYETVPRTTFATRGSKEVKVQTGGAHHKNITVALAVTASGSLLPPYLIYRRKTVPTGVELPGTIVSANNTAWMNTAELKKWIDLVLVPYSNGCRPLLVLDSAPSHRSADAKDALNAVCDVVMIPAGYTGKLQPLDLSVNKPLKDRLRCAWMKRALSLPRTGNVPPPSNSELCGWVKEACDGISKETVLAGWRKGCYSFAHNDPEDLEKLAEDEQNSAQVPFGDENIDEIIQGVMAITLFNGDTDEFSEEIV